MNNQFPFGQNSYNSSGYIGGYLNRLQNAVGQPVPTTIPRVNGENGAKSYPMAPNSEVLLLDETAPVIWVKKTDGGGYPSLLAYSVTPLQAEPAPDYKTLEQRISKLEVLLNEKSDIGLSGEQPTE